MDEPVYVGNTRFLYPIQIDEGADSGPTRIRLQVGFQACMEEPVFVCYLPKPLFRRLEPKSHMGRAIWLTWAYRFVFERTCSYREPAA